MTQGMSDDELIEELRKIHEEMATVMQILAVTAGEGVFRPGVYRKRDRYDQKSWERSHPNSDQQGELT